MKKWRRIFAIALALCMCLSITALAAEADTAGSGFVGTWSEKIAGRGNMEIKQSGNSYDIVVTWSGSAFQRMKWTMKGTYSAEYDYIEYSGGKKELETYESDGSHETEVLSTSESGLVMLVGKELYWYRDGYGINDSLTIFARAEIIPVVKPDFDDVKQSDYFYDAVVWAVETGVTEGVSSTEFAPYMTVNRAQAVTFLWRAAGRPDVPVTSTFSDVVAGSFYEKAVSWAVANGITDGTGGGKFSPNLTLNRAQMVTFLWRAAGKPAASGTGAFNDLQTGSFYETAVNWAAEKSIVSGTGGNFGPVDDCPRADVVTMLWLYDNLNSDSGDPVG